MTTSQPRDGAAVGVRPAPGDPVAMPPSVSVQVPVARQAVSAAVGAIQLVAQPIAPLRPGSESPETAVVVIEPDVENEVTNPVTLSGDPIFEGDWPVFAAQVTAGLGRPGLIGQFLQQSELLSCDADCLFLRVPVKPLAEAALVAKVRDALVAHFGRPVRLDVQVGQVQGTTVAAVRSREQAQALAQAHETIQSDAFVQSLLNDFGATIVPDSVQPIGPNAGDTQP